MSQKPQIPITKYQTNLNIQLLNQPFDKLKFDLITADAQNSNLKSIHILEKYLNFDKEFYNPIEKCTDRRYKLEKKHWLG